MPARLAFLSFAASLALGCATQAPLPRPASPSPGPAAAAPPKADEPDLSDVQTAAPSSGHEHPPPCTVPKGWIAMPSDKVPEQFHAVFINPAKQAMIMIRFIHTPNASPKQIAETFAENVKKSGGSVSAITSGEHEASFTYTAASPKGVSPQVKGAFYVRHQPETDNKATATNIGGWPDDPDGSLAKTLETVTKSCVIK